MRQWGVVTTTETTSVITFIPYTSKDSYVIMSLPTTQNAEDSVTYQALTKILSNSSASISWWDSNGTPRNKQWMTIGY